MQATYHVAIVEIVQEVDFEKDSEKEGSETEEEEDKLSQRWSASKLYSLVPQTSKSSFHLNQWNTPYLEINSPPPELS